MVAILGAILESRHNLDILKEVPDLYLCSYYFSYFAFNVNKQVKTIYLLL